jgi:ubiquinone/menaquinone biosynthesis C-methylase UbiE
MGVYELWVLPRLDLAMRNRLLDHCRQRTIETARGLVLEVGVGSGLNLRFYSRAVDRICGIDLSPELLRLAHERTADAIVPVTLIRASAEDLPFAVFDTIVMTWTLCSIASPLAALTEMRRVLKPGGDLLFVEHGLSPETRIARWQHWLTPCWKRIGGGCHLDRKMDDLIRAAGFQIDAIETSYMQGPKPWTFMYRGSAKNDRAVLSG